MKKNRRMILNTGTTSLVLIFTVLALVVFALLSLSSANAQWKLAQKMAERATQYYEGENEAQQTLYQVGELLDEIAAGSGEEAFLSQVRKAVEETDGLAWEDGKICWQTAVSEKQQIQAEVLPVYPGQNGEAAWRLERWELEETAEWENKQSVELFQG